MITITQEQLVAAFKKIEGPEGGAFVASFKKPLVAELSNNETFNQLILVALLEGSPAGIASSLTLALVIGYLIAEAKAQEASQETASVSQLA